MKLAERIEAAGLKVWLDKTNLLPGIPWQDQLEQAINKHSTAFAVYLTKAGAKDWVRMEVRIALSRVIDAGREGQHYPFIPIIAEDAGDIARLPAFAQQYQGIYLGDADALQKLIGVVEGREQATVPLVEEPFLGLEAFGADQAHIFFGREEETTEVIKRLRQNNFVMVVGDSGSGKSSLVKAGLLPALAEGQLADPFSPRPDPARWHIIEMRPQGDPFDKLAEAIERHPHTVKPNVELLESALRRLRANEPDAVRDVLIRSTPQDAQMFLVVDQFEELWTLAKEDARHAFLNGLLTLAHENDQSRRVVMTMRRDYYALVGTHAAFAARLEANERQGLYNLRRITDQGLRACIEKPLALAGVDSKTATELATEILRDAGNQSGELALIEMALHEIWQNHRKTGNSLLEAYRQIGHIEGAIKTAADAVYQNLTRQDNRRAETIFMRLVHLGDTGGTTRRVAALGEFDKSTTSLVQHLGSKEGKRLLVLGGDPVQPVTVELAHEQLSTQWPTYVRWLNNADGDPRADDKRTLDRLIDRTVLWLNNQRKWRDLATGSDRRNFQKLKHNRSHWLASSETKFVNRSVLRSRLMSAALGLLVLVLVGSGGWFVSYQEQLRIKAEAISIGFRLELDNPELTSFETKALLELATSDERKKDAFIRELLSNPVLSDRFTRQHKVVSRALTGLNLSMRGEIIEKYLLSRSSDTSEKSIQLARALLAIELEANGAIEFALSMMEPDNLDVMRLLMEALAALPAKLSPEQAERALKLILSAIEKSDDTFTQEPLHKGLAALSEKLNAEQAERGLKLILSLMEKPASPYTLNLLGQELVALSEKLNAEQAERSLKFFFRVMENLNFPYSLGFLVDGLVALPVKLNANQVERVLKLVLIAMENSDDRFTLDILGPGLASLSAKLSSEQAERALKLVLSTIENPDNSPALSALGQALVALSAKLSSAQSERALGRILSAMEQPASPHILGVLGQGLAALPTKLNAAQAERVLKFFLSAMEPDNPFIVKTLGRGLAAVSAKLSAEQAERAHKLILSLMEKPASRYTSGILGQGLAALSAKLSAEQAERALEPVLSAMEKPDNQYALRFLIEGLAALPAELSAEQVERAFKLVLSSADALTLGQALVALSATLSSEQAEQAFKPALSAMEKPGSSFGLEALGQALVALSATLSSEQAERALKLIFSLMAKPDHEYTLEILSQGLAALSARLSAEEGVQSLVDAMRVPWMVGTPTDVLTQAIRERFADDKSLQNAHGLWGMVQWIEKNFRHINLARPPEFSATTHSLARNASPE